LLEEAFTPDRAGLTTRQIERGLYNRTSEDDNTVIGVPQPAHHVVWVMRLEATPPLVVIGNAAGLLYGRRRNVSLAFLMPAVGGHQRDTLAIFEDCGSPRKAGVSIPKFRGIFPPPP
jgi:hypothetical protein